MPWLYALAFVPVVTDIVESGGVPDSPREWLTELVAGIVIAALVRRVLREHSTVLALAKTDGLTGLWNRRMFEDAIADECARARRAGQPLSLVYFDVDRLKQVNDRHGHQRGDQVLQAVATAVRQAARARVDRGFRLGGDEFALLLPGSTAAQAKAVVARVRALVSQLGAMDHDTEGFGLSAGIVELDAAEAVDHFVKRADAAMYQQKRARC